MIVEGAKFQACSLPSVKMIRSVDGPAYTLVLTDGPVLMEVRGSLDARRVDALSLVDLVKGTVAGKVPDMSYAIGRIGGAEVLENVVLGKRIGKPAIDR